MMSTPPSSIADPEHAHANPGPTAQREQTLLLLDRVRPGRLLSGTVLLGLAGSLLLATMAVGAGGILVIDPLITAGPLSWIRYGHGRDLATVALYLGVGMLVWAWVRLGRDVLDGTVTVQHVQAAGAVWIAPMVLSPPLFTRDVYSYLAQGALALRGLDPYQVGPSELPPGPIADNVHYAWQITPAPYGPLFIFIAKIMNWLTDEDAIAGVIGMRLVLLAGLGLLVFALPRLADQLGGNQTVALWLVVANPMTVVHLVGGPHNDLLMIGLLAMGTLLVLQHKHAAGITVVTVAMAVKASAGVALPFLVWIWAAHLPWAVTMPLHDLSSTPFIFVFRILGSVVFLGIFVRQWWLARDGGPEAVRRAAIALLWSALLAPATLPWYFTWALVLAAALPWRRSLLTWAVVGSTWLVLATYPTGESAFGSVPYHIGMLAIALLAGTALLRRDPLQLRVRIQRTEATENA